MKTKKIGELLREQRESRRLSIEQISRLTHIKPDYLRLIEENQFELLPAAVYVKGYVSSMARVFGVEPAPLLALLRRDYKESNTGVLMLQGDTSRRRVPLWRGSIKWPSITIGAILTTIFIYVLAQWLISQQPPKLVVENFAEMTVIEQNAIIKGRTSPEALVFVNDQPAALRPDGSFSFQLQLEQAGLVTIKIEAKDQRGESTILEKSVQVVPPAER